MQELKYPEQTAAAVELLKKLIATPSLSRNESSAADIVEQALHQAGYSPERHANNVWACSHDFIPGRTTILLDAHLDTVKPAAGWTFPPFEPTETPDGRIYGLGANDDGGSLVALMQAFFELDKEPSANFIFMASAEEEVSGKDGIEAALPLLPPIDYAVVGEPTSLQPAIAEKGLMVVDVTCHGRAGHAARNEGDNAIYHALDDIAYIRSVRFERVSPLLGPVKATVTIVNAGTLHNVIPDRCQYTIDVRSNELYTNEELLAIISSHLSGEAHPRSTRLSSSGIPTDHPLVRRALELGLQPFGSPTLSNQALMRFPSLKIGPGDSARSHTADEYITKTEIDNAIALYIKLLK